MVFRCLVFTLAVAMCALVMPIYSQINTPCSPPMITRFPPCLNLLMNSTTNSSTTPTSDCCNFFKTLMSNGTDCLCFIVRSAPFQIPFNQSLVLALPRACGMPGVPLQCKAAAVAPISPTGPATLVPAPAPGNSSTVPGALPPALAPESNTTPTLTPPLAPKANTTPDQTPPSTGVGSGVPSTNSGSRPTLTPSAAASTYDNLPFILVASGATFMAYLMLF